MAPYLLKRFITPQTLASQNFKNQYKYFILIVTFLSYLTYHASRKPITIVKAELHMNCSSIDPNHHHNSSNWCDWKPFDNDNYKNLFSQLDYGFLLSYAIGMFFSGMIAERTNMRYFLFVGMQLSALFTVLFGLGYILKIHRFSFYLLTQISNGFVQSSGWPAVVALMGNWFGKSKRGFIMGVWNSHTSFGNIIGSLVASEYVESDWALSFIVPGVMIGIMGWVVFLTVITSPGESGGDGIGEVSSRDRGDINALLGDVDSENLELSGSENDDDQVLAQEVNSNNQTNNNNNNIHQAITFKRALMIPGVIEFSLSLFFAKLVSYTFLFWLPFYLSSAFDLDPRKSGNFSTIFDIGGIIGGILAGSFSDYTGHRAITCTGMLTIGSVFLFLFQTVAEINTKWMVICLFLTGMAVNGPYALITTAVSADLGTHSSLQGNAVALATVTSIIDGVGSIGAATGPFLVGIVAGKDSDWSRVFVMLLICNLSSLLCLIKLVRKEWNGQV